MIPFYLSFGEKVFSSYINKLLLTIDLIIKFIFAIDILVGFRRAYIHERTGQEIKCPILIAKKYLEKRKDHYYLKLLIWSYGKILDCKNFDGAFSVLIEYAIYRD